MSVIYFLIPIAILLLVVGVVAFMWATKTSQFEDLEKQGLSILMDDEPSDVEPLKNSARDHREITSKEDNTP